MTEIFTRADSTDLADAVRRLLRDLDRTHGPGASLGECRPPLDVYETGDDIEVALDLPGLSPDDVRVVVRENAVIIVGEKAASPCAAKEARFHLAERTFGRFARAVRLLTPVDAARARAELQGGRLRVIVPRIEDRRGRDIPVTVTRVS
ncbi:MAG: Hsp20/alpha crystallin family protein [Acidobacteriota bacterium]|nr:Hsp20/alpha crystallin family protein [Acidobacteriota bacterium]